MADLLFAHGPWYTELHHFPEILVTLPTMIAFATATGWRLLRWRKPRGDSPSVQLFSRSCSFCPHPAGQHRWAKPVQGEKIEIDPNKTRCHQCYCPYYKDGGPRES